MTEDTEGLGPVKPFEVRYRKLADFNAAILFLYLDTPVSAALVKELRAHYQHDAFDLWIHGVFGEPDLVVVVRRKPLKKPSLADYIMRFTAESVKVDRMRVLPRAVHPYLLESWLDGGWDQQQQGRGRIEGYVIVNFAPGATQDDIENQPRASLVHHLREEYWNSIEFVCQLHNRGGPLLVKVSASSKDLFDEIVIQVLQKGELVQSTKTFVVIDHRQAQGHAVNMEMRQAILASLRLHPEGATVADILRNMKGQMDEGNLRFYLSQMKRPEEGFVSLSTVKKRQIYHLTERGRAAGGEPAQRTFRESFERDSGPQETELEDRGSR